MHQIQLYIIFIFAISSCYESCSFFFFSFLSFQNPPPYSLCFLSVLLFFLFWSFLHALLPRAPYCQTITFSGFFNISQASPLFEFHSGSFFELLLR